MEFKKSVALMTIFQVPNYGSVLQTFATQSILNRLGYNCVIINYHYPNNWHFSNGFTRPRPLASVLKSLVKRLNFRNADKFLNKIEKFRRKHLNFSRKYKSIEDLESENWTQYDAVIAGSDQIWNPRYLHGDKAFLLSFVPDRINKISVASSFACKKLNTEYITKFKQYISRFNRISVRDNNGVQIITNDLGITTKPFVALDPTLLLSANEWQSLLPAKSHKSEPYLLVYILSYAFNPYPYVYSVVEEMRHRYNCKVIFIGEQYKGNNQDYESCPYASPEEFIQLFNGAQCVITTSFHGTAFAVNSQRPLISIVPNNGDDRQTSLLVRLGISSCAVKIGTPLNSINPNYNFADAESKLSSLRKENIDWIKESLSNNC